MPDDGWIEEALDKIIPKRYVPKDPKLKEEEDKVKKDLAEFIKWAYDDGWDAGAQAALHNPNQPRMRWVKQTVEHHRLTMLFSNIETQPLSSDDERAIINFIRMQRRKVKGKAS